MISGLKYHTYNHPIFRDFLKVKFLSNGVPYIRVSGVTQLFSVNRFFEWNEKGYFENDKAIKTSIEVILNVISHYEQIDAEIIKAKCRKREIVQARQLAHYLAKELTDKSLKDIGFEIGRKNHATVLHSHKTISNYLDVYPEWRKRIYDIKERLVN